MSIETMKQALEAFDCIYSPLHVREINKASAAMSALRTAIQQAESKPVAWMVSIPEEPDLGEWFSEEDMSDKGYTSKPLYTHPIPGVPRGAVNLGAHSLASELAQAVAQDDDDPEGHDMSAGLFGPNVSAWLRKVAADFLSHPAPGVPDDVVRDAQRYRWLRDFDHWPAPFASSQEPEPIRGTDLDAAIDAAMQKGGE